MITIRNYRSQNKMNQQGIIKINNITNDSFIIIHNLICTRWYPLKTMSHKHVPKMTLIYKFDTKRDPVKKKLLEMISQPYRSV